ncbi:MAG: hypothetical protein WA775_06410 [Psychroserpens sp.]|uniref:hypothetical protein n=1 Tax=Psychroserpens sp. TaxID=2020870 RepID=UPI003C794F23
MKNSTLFFAVALLYICSNSMIHAQDVGSNQTLLEGSGAFLVTMDNKNKDAIGSPYLYKDFTVAKISATSDVYKMRYNAFNDEIEVKVGGDKIKNFNKNLNNVVITFLDDDLNFLPLNYIDVKNGLQRGYFVSLTDNKQKVKLYSKKEISFIEAKPAITSYDSDKPAEFKRLDDTFFVSINDAYARALPTKKKDIAKMFPKHAKEVITFIKENRIETSEEKDLIQLINYINTL